MFRHFFSLGVVAAGLGGAGGGRGGVGRLRFLSCLLLLCFLRSLVFLFHSPLLSFYFTEKLN